MWRMTWLRIAALAVDVIVEFEESRCLRRLQPSV
jgi:hypothetical protein